MARRLLIAVLLTALLAGCGDRDSPTAPQSGVVSIVQDDAELLHRSDAQTAATLDDLKAEGVDWVRVTAGWSVIAPNPQSDHAPPGFAATDPDAYPEHAWDALDRLDKLARERGLKLSIDIAFWAPRWAVRNQAEDRTRANERDGVDPFSYAQFAEAVARRYRDAASFTIWNEPNHTAFLLPQFAKDASGRYEPASPAEYRQMLYKAVPRIKAITDAPVLIGATSSVGAAEGTSARDRMAPLTFLRALACVDEHLVPTLDAPGCRGFTTLPGDGFSHHPYALTTAPETSDPHPDNVPIGDLDRLTTLLHGLAAAHRTEKDLPVYLTEFGYQTNPPDPTWPTTLAQQATYLARAERLARANPDVRSTAQFLIRDLPERPGGDLRTRWRDYQSGLRFADGSAKPSLDAYALPLTVGANGDVWGLVRPGTGPQDATLERRARGSTSWTTVATFKTRDDGTFTTRTRITAGDVFRLRSGDRTGMATSATPSDGGR